jgi:toxin ParE1/3/4
VQLEWSARARVDRAEIVHYIATDNVAAAIRTGDKIVEQVRKLREFPSLGRIGRVRRSRELVIPGTPYLVAYRVETELVRILRVLHASQQWPKRL